MKLNETLFDIEQRFVAAIFHDADVLDLLDRANLDYEIIENDFLRSILKLCMAERSKGDLVDMPKLRRQMFLDGGVVPDKSEFMELIDAADTSFHAIEDFKLIVTDYKRRATLTHALILQTLANDKDWEENQAKAKGVMQSINEIDIAEKPLSHRDRAKASLKNRQNIVDGKIGSEAVRIETGIYCIDRYCRPLSTATGDFNCLLFAATSTGKSSLMAQIVSHNTFRNLNVAVFLGETNYEWQDKCRSALSMSTISSRSFRINRKNTWNRWKTSHPIAAIISLFMTIAFSWKTSLQDARSSNKKLET